MRARLCAPGAPLGLGRRGERPIDGTGFGIRLSMLRDRHAPPS
ncbi:hypothetical protein F8B43_2113 [Methylorubrum populi]|uniref:Uncharacterized protein n=1 Tax=Methylorubrum populi TaxID=223967 RepID=A0A833J8R3_9HYPH|nr:hypothetical protein F8B43_2113 [Methylorubrum populi]